MAGQIGPMPRGPVRQKIRATRVKVPATSYRNESGPLGVIGPASRRPPPQTAPFDFKHMACGGFNTIVKA